MPRQTLSQALHVRNCLDDLVGHCSQGGGRGGCRMADEGKDHVGPNPGLVSGWKTGKGVPSPLNALISVQASSRAEEGPAPQVPQETPG